MVPRGGRASGDVAAHFAASACHEGTGDIAPFAPAGAEEAGTSGCFDGNEVDAVVK